MNWLRKLVSGGSVGAQPPLEPAFADLLADHGLAAYARQLAFAKLAGDRDWLLDQDAGILHLGEDLAFPAQILGTESAGSQTWLWAWANPSIEGDLTMAARSAQALGAARGIAILTDSEVALARIGDAHLMALALSGVLDADAYYRCPYDGGAAYVLVDLPLAAAVDERPTGRRAADVVKEALLNLPILVSRRSVERYLEGLDASTTATTDSISVDAGPTFTFDSLGRLTSLDETLQP